MLELIFWSLIGGLFSLIGGSLLLIGKTRTSFLIRYATPFAAGALVAAACSDLLPEAVASSEAGVDRVFYSVMFGIVSFFILENTLHWWHHHRKEGAQHVDKSSTLIIVGDTLHNMLDGVAIAAAFLVGQPVGISTALAVAAHEIPQEIGDFGLLLSRGFSKRKVLAINVISSLATTVTALIFYRAGHTDWLPENILLGGVAGMFLYIALADIVPDIHESSIETKGQKRIFRFLDIRSIIFVLGIAMVTFMTKLTGA